MSKFLMAMLLGAAILQSPAVAQSKNETDDDYETYQKTRQLGLEMFKQYLDKNGAAIRISAVLKSCSKDGLAKAIEDKETDRNFMEIITTFIRLGKFSDLPSYAVLQTQSAAYALIVGYGIGYQEAVELNVGTPNETMVCGAAVDAANKVLAK
jgi:hypothetical protein